MGEDFTTDVSKSLGSEYSKTSTAIEMALPLLIGSLKKNAVSDGGKGVMQAVSKKHNGGIFDNLSGLIQNPDAGEGAEILGHLFGRNEQNAEKLLASQAGVSEAQSANIMKILAPMVMGAVGKQAKESSGFNISSLLSMVTSGAQESDKKSSLSSSLLTKFLDKDKDGSIVDDLINMGVKKFMS